ncbi:complex I 51 kDa subunit family protein [Peloplasma aerotolerans]|uniref:NADH-ubiquinone oxidoreductase-F iron-sulfur binding region domain-containing protein n=1 Tax=Peloplasma aerotolerans TaxID=3044389 RepID=A0AAW6U925_9MOLU|nr:NADH-ubiquinone oxidoreductase-F iron-sulfur binding region domain-containing protein [Mariniplasma sp. M4Ah]MDI6452561.1 NADH-ubiquinone oxidoreductase-F iron-sulfur binding region domain-containing protein [Mariniplasma sp. M4Ah]
MIEQRLITSRIGKIDPFLIENVLDLNGYEMFKKALKMDRLDIIDEIEKSKLRGRGGAGFPVSIKLIALAKEKDFLKYLICNADEGEPGNFKDRYLMENDPHQILEGMLIAAYATHATKGYIYIRGEFDHAISIMKNALKEMKSHHLLGDNILDTKFSFDIEIRSGAGSYVCGEEFALLESIEGKAGRTRVKPPFPTSKGLFDKPTLINNVETFATIPVILKIGGQAYSEIGTPSSTGTKLISLSGNIKNKGVFEIPFGISIRDVIKKLGGGVPGNRKIKMVQLGGACGPMIPEYMLDMIIDFERFEEFESKTGAGAIIVIDDRFDMFDLLVRISEFFAHESCGKCTPCREGNFQLINTLKKFQNKEATEKDLVSLESQARVMHQTSLCGLGQTAPTAIISTLHFFRWEYINRIEHSLTKEVS